jgi:CRP/FNR family transcriptional regulator
MTTPALLADAFRQHLYFRTLDDSRLAALIAQAVRREFAPGEILFIEGERSAGLWVIESGSVKIYRVSLEGREHIIRFFGSGDSFNEIPALDGGPNPVSAEALTDVTAWVLPSGVTQAAVRSDLTLMQNIVDGLSERIRMLVGQIESLALLSVPARLAKFLLAQVEEPSGDEESVTRAAIAAHLATTPETISRVLRTMEEAGAIQFDRHRIVIVDEDLLHDFAVE